MAAITQLVPKQYLGHANGMAQFGVAAGNLLAPLLGGALVLMIGLSGIVLIDCVTFLFAITTLLLVRFPDTLFLKSEEPLLQEIVGGWRYIVKRRSLVTMIVFFVVTNFFFSIMIVLLTPLVLSFGSSTVLGTVIAVNAGGALTGGLMMGLWGGTQRRAEGMVKFVMLLGLSALVIGLRPVPVYAAIGAFGVGVAVAFVNAHWLALIQTKVGLELQGRVLATIQMLEWAMVPLGFALVGPLADRVFEPLLANGGPLAASIGRLIGVGPGRGMGLMMVLVGGMMLLVAIVGYWYRPLRFMEDQLPDAIPGAVIVADKDALQEQADRQLAVETR
jgi:MFS family permease